MLMFVHDRLHLKTIKKNHGRQPEQHINKQVHQQLQTVAQNRLDHVHDHITIGMFLRGSLLPCRTCLALTHRDGADLGITSGPLDVPVQPAVCQF